jgi:hypothetical protein
VSSFEQRIEEILRGVYATEHDAVEAALAYAANFQSEGERKTRFVINRIDEFDVYTRESLSDYLAVSIGGADASDLLALVQRTQIRKTILLEYDNAAADRANKYSKPLIEATGGSLQVLIGDAVQQLEAIVSILKEARAGGSVGLLCLCFGVLHELPRRSPGFELRHYFARLTSVFDRNLLFLSEPCLPPYDQAEMELSVSTISEDRLFELLGHVNAHLFDNRQPIRKLSHGFVRAGFPLIIETLHKLLRYDSIPRFRHEMGERLTQFTPDQFLDALRITLPGAHLERNELVSDGFRRAYHNADVVLRCLDGQVRGMPFSHVQVSAISLPTVVELSLLAFNDALPVENFVFQNARLSHEGINGTLEVRNGKNLTNCHSQVELKSAVTDPGKNFNADGSYSCCLNEKCYQRKGLAR